MRRSLGSSALAAAIALVASSPAPCAARSDPAADHSAWLDRLTWGANESAQRALDAAGRDRWIEDQLRGPATAPLPPAAQAQIDAMRITREPMAQTVVAITAQYRADKLIVDPAQRQAGLAAYQQAMAQLAREAATRAILRDLYSPAQLTEQMTWFWFNHFNVRAQKHDIRAMVGDYEDVIRAHALGRFRDLLEAVLRHPAMLRYLDNDQNVAGRINENYAREIMELHSLGLGGGYSQGDVQELARILTGVGVRLTPAPPALKPEWTGLYVRAGLFAFDPARHDFGDKRFLGHVIKGSGFAEVEQALDLIAASPATARHVSAKIARYFMGDAPPPAIVARMTASFQRSGGDIAEVLRTMLRAPGFAATLGGAVKDPLHYVLSAVRLGYDGRVVANVAPILGWIGRMGEAPYAHPEPDGYPLSAAAWTGPGQMARRFEVARQIGRGGAPLFGAETPGATASPAPPPPLRAAIDALGIPPPAPASRAALAQADSPGEWNALYLSSPEFMRR